MDLKIFQTGPLEVNTYILTDEQSKEAVIIDIGGEFETIKKELDEKGFKIKFILNTHGHFDHLLGEIEIPKKYPNIPIYMSEADIFHVNNINNELKMWRVNKETEPLRPIKFIDENTKLTLGDQEIKIFATPGHSKGSLSFYIDGKLFSGDALFKHSIGRTDFIDGDYDTLISSIKTKLFTLPDETKVYPGHGPSSTIKDEKKFNPYLN